MRIPLAFLILAWALPAAADQVVVADVTYEHGAETTSDSHYRLDPTSETPADLTSPVDYASGFAVVRLEVFTKPTVTPTRFQVCFEASPTYACTNQAPAYTETGVYTWETPFSSFYQGDMVDWSRGLGRIALILKDTMNGKPSPENVGEETSRLYMPTDLRVTVTLVTEGDTYVPPEEAMPDAGVDAGTDAGASDAGFDAGARDAGSDAGARDTGARDSGARVDAGGEVDDGGCSVGRRSSPAWSLVLALFFLRRRRSLRPRS